MLSALKTYQKIQGVPMSIQFKFRVIANIYYLFKGKNYVYDYVQ